LVCFFANQFTRAPEPTSLWNQGVRRGGRRGIYRGWVRNRRLLPTRSRQIPRCAWLH